MKTNPLKELNPVQIQRFLSNVDKKSEDECWPWKKYKNKNGYGMVGFERGYLYYSHRVAWSLVNGEIPENHMVLHHCDNPQCCNPSHLFIGIQRDNMLDMAKKDRSTFGEKSGRAKLTEEQVRYILSVNGTRKRGTGYRALAKKFGVDRTSIRLIVTGINWKRVSSNNAQLG